VAKSKPLPVNLPGQMKLEKPLDEAAQSKGKLMFVFKEHH
jgi:hypothetical protein